VVHHDWGVELGSTPIWALDWAVRPGATVVSSDPLRVAVPVTCDQDRLTPTLDAECRVIEERWP
jgi:hypothetical protein